MSVLSKKWSDLWQRLGVGSASSASFGEMLVKAYNEPSRFYHNQVHLEDVLAKLDFAKTALEKSGEVAHLSPPDKQRMYDVIELSLWYHDAVYDATAKDNEAKSRDLFLSHARTLGLGGDIQKEVADLIDLTAHHKDAKTLPERIMTDCDLAILGAPDAEFKNYDTNIRREYAHIPATIFNPRRVLVLGGFLNQPGIFKTKAFQDAFEEQARSNLNAATMSPVKRFLKKFTF